MTIDKASADIVATVVVASFVTIWGHYVAFTLRNILIELRKINKDKRL